MYEVNTFYSITGLLRLHIQPHKGYYGGMCHIHHKTGCASVCQVSVFLGQKTFPQGMFG